MNSIKSKVSVITIAAHRRSSVVAVVILNLCTRWR
jgi:hypothetical protein